ncbi:MAG: peptidase M15, partial [Desulfobacterales bacterium]|nr:peptidase M15 [Desulfobacterales bacterium]
MQRRNFIKCAALALWGLQTSTLWAKPDSDYPLDHGVKDRLVKSRFFKQAYTDDVILPQAQQEVLTGCLARLKRVQRYVGYGNFALLGFDQAIYLARNYSRIGAFTRVELDFMEMIFYNRADAYGFMGEKPIESITQEISRKKIKKIPRTGNYLYRGEPEKVYASILKQVGKDAVLTSGVRGVMKQFLLF